MSRTLSVSLPDQKILPFLTGRPEAEFLVWDMTEPPPRPVIDIVVPPYMGRIDLLRALDGVTTSLVQSQSIGFDGVAEVLPPGSIFANAAGVHETSTAELVLALLLASQRSLPEYVRQQDRGEWKQLTSPSPVRPSGSYCRLRRRRKGH